MYILHNTESRNAKIVDNNLCFGELSFHSFMNLRIQVSENIQDGSPIKTHTSLKIGKCPISAQILKIILGLREPKTLTVTNLQFEKVEEVDRQAAAKKRFQCLQLMAHCWIYRLPL